MRRYADVASSMKEILAHNPMAIQDPVVKGWMSRRARALFVRSAFAEVESGAQPNAFMSAVRGFAQHIPFLKSAVKPSGFAERTLIDGLKATLGFDPPGMVKAEVARQALDAGASIVNDITGLRGDPEMPAVCREYGAGVIVMHMQGTPATMQANPAYADVVREVEEFFRGRLRALADAGLDPESVCLDPGIGFGKTPDQNLALVRGLPRLAALGRPLLVGLSRKSTLAKITNGPDAKVASDAASVGGAVVAFGLGASIFRVHDVRPHVEALAVAAALERGTVSA